jgi:hypothetical protein
MIIPHLNIQQNLPQGLKAIFLGEENSYFPKGVYLTDFEMPCIHNHETQHISTRYEKIFQVLSCVYDPRPNVNL